MERTPGGSQTRSKAHHVFGGAPFPKTLTWAMGTIVGNEENSWTDWIAGLGAVGLGYGAVDHRVLEQIDLGVTFPLPTRLEEKVADDLCQLLHWPEQVRWVKTGSEATVAAMLIARRATGRRRVLSIGYHGWHEAHLPGPDLIDIPWGSPEWRRHLDGRVAAVLLEPMRDSHPPEDYLFGIQSRCRDVGALLIMDEMVTGFRWAIGGACEYYKLVPDLACYGKALGNGWPIACVVGPRRLMKYAVDVSSTFGGECAGLAAAEEVMRVYRTERVCEKMWALGTRLMKACPALTGWPVHPRFMGVGDYTTSDANIPTVQAAAARGHLIHPAGFNIMAAHTEADVDNLAEAINAGV